MFQGLEPAVKKKMEIPGSFTQPNLISTAPRNVAGCGESLPAVFTGMAVESLENQGFPRQTNILKNVSMCLLQLFGQEGV